MYKIQYTLSATKDIYEIFNYISNTLKNKTAALELMKKLKTEEENIILFPYGNPKYRLKKLDFKYRRAIVNNYSIFYTIDKKKKLITVSRILYNKREFRKVLN